MQRIRKINLPGVFGRIMLVAVLAGCIQPAYGFWRKSQKAEPRQLFPHAVNHNLHPPMVVRTGTLSRDGRGNWTLGDLTLYLSDRKGAASGTPRGRNVAPLAEGRPISAMGTVTGGIMVVHYICPIEADRCIQRGTYFERTVEGLPTKADPGLPR
ncbi:MAG: hypothetical protein AB7V45_11790 [Candidatus Krumholzibacteriia bacterium]